MLIHCNHGLGDTIQFIRYAARLRTIAREVIVRAPAELLPLLSTVRGIDRLLAAGDVVSSASCDAEVEVMELAYIFRSTVRDVPRDMPYVHVDAARLGGRGLRVGVVWRSGPWDTRRTMSFDEVSPLFAHARRVLARAAAGDFSARAPRTAPIRRHDGDRPHGTRDAQSRSRAVDRQHACTSGWCSGCSGLDAAAVRLRLAMDGSSRRQPVVSDDAAVQAAGERRLAGGD